MANRRMPSRRGTGHNHGPSHAEPQKRKGREGTQKDGANDRNRSILWACGRSGDGRRQNTPLFRETLRVLRFYGAPDLPMTKPMRFARTTSRRRFLLGAAALVAAAPAIGKTGRDPGEDDASRALAFQHLHTGERLAIAYAIRDQYVPASLAAINRVLRDHRTGEVHAIDPTLLDQLHQLQRVTGSRAPYEIICGYRSPRSNEMLRERSSGVAKTSLHLEGRAIDIRLADVSLSDLRDAALELRAGGVGYYSASNFMHLDTGRVRSW